MFYLKISCSGSLAALPSPCPAGWNTGEHSRHSTKPHPKTVLKSLA